MARKPPVTIGNVLSKLTPQETIISPPSLEQRVSEHELRRDLLSLTRRLRDQESANRTLKSEREDLLKRAQFFDTLNNVVVAPPDWTSWLPKTKHQVHVATPTLLMSDWHLDERVRAAEIEGLNCYNREIALLRVKQTAMSTIELARDYLKGLKYEGIVVGFNGDMVSGAIHDELKETNVDTVISSVVFWVDHIVAMLGTLADEFKKVHAFFIAGNHGRDSRKPRAKQMARSNFDWMMGQFVAKALQSDKRFTFQVPDSGDLPFKLYNTRYLWTHGDAFQGGSGISAMLSPLFIGQARTQLRNVAMDRPFDILVTGHRHTYWNGLGIIVNGAGKGYDEYAYKYKFRFEPPQQAFWITVPEHREITLAAPIFCASKIEKSFWD